VSLDRRKNDIDVMERVLGGARDDDNAPHTDVVQLEVKPWFAGTTESVMQLTVLGHAEPDDKPGDKD
jgi:hypothetical protein